MKTMQCWEAMKNCSYITRHVIKLMDFNSVHIESKSTKNYQHKAKDKI